MSNKYDVIVIGAGAAGLSAAALLAKEGKKVVVVEASRYLGGRGMAVEEEGFTLNLGSHLLEDPGDGITKILEYVGKTLPHGPKNSDLMVWDNDQGTWGSIRDRYQTDKTELKKVIKALTEMPYEDFDKWDDQPMRAWLSQHTSDQGVHDLFDFITVLEGMTENWWDHAASDNLFCRKHHFEVAHTAAYSFWPGRGWDGLFQDLHDAVIEHGGEVRMNTPAEHVVIENGQVRGLMIGAERKLMINEVFEGEVLEADCVISSLPVWNVLRVVPEQHLPEWYTDQIKFLAQDKHRITWLGLYMATEEPIHVNDERELATWLETPTAGVSGHFFNQSAMDRSSAPEGTNLYVGGGNIPGSKGKDKEYVLRKFEQFEADLKVMYPGLENAFFRRRHLVHDPSFGVIQKPGLVGTFRPHWRAPNVDGLYFASETFRSRGIGVDRAARAGLTVVEDYLGKKLDGGFGWRY